MARKAYVGLFWQILGFSLNTCLSVAHIVIMARLLSPDIFGQFAIASVVIAVTMIVSEFGLGPAIVQKPSISDEDVTFVFIFNILMGLFLFLLLAVFSGYISSFFNNAITPLMIIVIAMCLLAQPIGLASKSLLLRKMEFRHIFIATNLSYFLGMLLVGVTLALLGYGVWALIIGFLATKVVASLYFLFVSRIPFSFKKDNMDARYLCIYGVGLTSVQGINQFSLIADKLILSQITSSASVGLYERSQRIQQMPSVFLGGVLDNVLFSTLSRFSGNKTVLGQHFFNFVMLCSLIGVYLSVLLLTFSDVVVDIMLGPNWTEASAILQVLALLVGFQLLSRMGDTYIRSTGVFKKSLAVKLCYPILIFSFAIIGHQIIPLKGAIVGFVVAGIIHTVMLIWVCQKDCEYPAHAIWQRLRPSFILAAMLLFKNFIILYYVPSHLLVTISFVIVSDIIVMLVLSKSDYLLGPDNKQFIQERSLELFTLVKSRLSR